MIKNTRKAETNIYSNLFCCILWYLDTLKFKLGISVRFQNDSTHFGKFRLFENRSFQCKQIYIEVNSFYFKAKIQNILRFSRKEWKFKVSEGSVKVELLKCCKFLFLLHVPGVNSYNTSSPPHPIKYTICEIF